MTTTPKILEYNGHTLTLSEQVHQLFCLGYSGAEPTPQITALLQNGLGGVIFFRDNFQSYTHPKEVAQLLSTLGECSPKTLPIPFLSIDQEGGQVERLPGWLFPNLITPRAISLASDPVALAGEVYSMMASHLSLLGFNLNFFPTLDVNLNPDNPVIGVRSFGSDPDLVWRCAKKAIDKFRAFGIIPVGKHFPGHGNGTVDSHERLPQLILTEAELGVFKAAIADNIEAVMVSHGYYPSLQEVNNEKDWPASLSPTVIQKLLRTDCGYQGLVITDDLCMGAIGEQTLSATEIAIQALKAGADVLLYKDSGDTQIEVIHNLIDQAKSDNQLRQIIATAAQRILNTKQKLLPITPNPAIFDKWTPQYLENLTDPIAQKSVHLISTDSKIHPPLNPNARYLLVHPKRESIINYSFDQGHSPELPECFKQAGFYHLTEFSYAVKETCILPHFQQFEFEKPDAILFLSFNAQIHTGQQQLFAQVKTRYPETPLILVSVGTPEDADSLKDYNLQLALCSYRPPSMKALVSYLT